MRGNARMSASETTRNTGNQTFGLMKIADSATRGAQVGHERRAHDQPADVRLREARSTSTAYTTASEVVDSAVPAISDARPLQSSTK